MSAETEFMLKLKETFKGEAEEHRAELLASLRELEKGDSDAVTEAATVERTFRQVHSLKGAARAVEMVSIERVCQAMEGIFYGLKKGLRQLEQRMFRALYSALDLIAELAEGKVTVPDKAIRDVIALLKESPEITAGTEAADEAPVAREPVPDAAPARRTSAPIAETVRVPAKRLGSIFLQAEEMLSVSQIMAGHALELDELLAIQSGWNRSWSKLDPTLRKLRGQAADNAPLSALLEFLDRYDEYSTALVQRLDSLGGRVDLESFHTGEKVNSLLAEIKTSLMMPFSVLLESFPHMVQDLAREEGKQASWEVLGEDAQIDRRVLEEIKDPLIHITRNCISHGIEKPAERELRGKPQVGAVSLRVEKMDNNKIEFTVSDDGEGVNLAEVKAAAVRLGLVKEADAAAMNDQDALGLIFLTELSTSPMITDISGRGLGLAIAREKIENIGGSLSVKSIPGKGTDFHIKIPLSMATFRGVLVRCAGQTFVIPTASVDQVLRVDQSLITRTERRRSFSLKGQAVTLVDLCEVLGVAPLEKTPDEGDSCLALVLYVSGRRIALRVEEVVGEQEVFAKNLGKQLTRVRNISSATVLASGEVVPILNPFDLIRSAAQAAQAAALGDTAPRAPASKKRVLVADDSVTSRMLLKTMLESAGYLVKVTMDGAEAFALLRVDPFDLLVSDIDMPRMNGITLCERVRANAATANLPIVLVTSLDSREDREKGLDAGANAYIAKSSFDQSNLLDVVQRLL